METRSLKTSDYTTEGNTLIGYAAVWDTEYRAATLVSGRLKPDHRECEAGGVHSLAGFLAGHRLVFITTTPI